MLHLTKFTCLFCLFTVISCGGIGNAEMASDNATGTSSSRPATTANDASSVDGIVGQWELKYIAVDKNMNKELEQAEIDKAITQAKDYLQFNADGSCLFTPLKTKGQYKIVEDKGRKKLQIFVAEYGDKPYNKYDIKSVTKDELQLLKFSGEYSFQVYKRL